MMRKTSLVLLGAVAGAAVTLVAVQPSSRLLIGSSARAAQADTYRQLNLFGDIFERVRSHYVEKPDDSKLVESAINGMLNGLDPRFTKPEAGIPHDAAHGRDGLLAIFVNELKLRPIIGVQAIAQTQREKD